MSFNPLEIAKKHPVLTGVGVFAIGIVVVLMFSGGTPEAAQPLYTTTGTDPSTVAANTALAQTQLQAGVQNQATAASLSLGMADIAARSKAAELTSNTDNLALNLQSTVALAQITAQKDTQTMVSQLSASVAQAQIDAQKAMTANANTTQVQIASLSKDVQETQARYNAMMMESMNTRDITINGQNNAAQANLAAVFANTQIQTQAIQSDTTKFTAQKNAEMFGQQIDLQKFNTAWTQDTMRQQAALNAGVQNHMLDVNNNQNALNAQSQWRYIDSQNYQVGRIADVQNNQNALNAQTQWKQIDAQNNQAALNAQSEAARLTVEQQRNDWAHQEAVRQGDLNFLMQNAQLYQNSYNQQFAMMAYR